MKNKLKTGFLLFEVILYLSLFSLMAGSSLSVFYHILESNQKISEESLLADESAFILGKISGILFNVSDIDTPLPGFTSETLSIIDIFGEPISITLEDGKVLLQRGNNLPKALNTSSVKVENLEFENKIVSENPRASVVIGTFSVNNSTFKVSKFNPSL